MRAVTQRPLTGKFVPATFVKWETGGSGEALQQSRLRRRPWFRQWLANFTDAFADRLAIWAESPGSRWIHFG